MMGPRLRIAIGALAVLLLLWLVLPHSPVVVVVFAWLVLAAVGGTVAASLAARSLEDARRDPRPRRRPRSRATSLHGR